MLKSYKDTIVCLFGNLLFEKQNKLVVLLNITVLLTTSLLRREREKKTTSGCEQFADMEKTPQLNRGCRKQASISGYMPRSFI